jgi:hypothetical protein
LAAKLIQADWRVRGRYILLTQLAVAMGSETLLSNAPGLMVSCGD